MHTWLWAASSARISPDEQSLVPREASSGPVPVVGSGLSPDLAKVELVCGHEQAAAEELREVQQQLQRSRQELRLQRSSRYVFPTRVQHLHFSGCAGTSVRAFAATVTPIADMSNGNAGCSCGQSSWIDAMVDGATRCLCVERWGYMWQATESPVMVALGCPITAYWTVLRPPVERVVSRIYKKSWDVTVVKEMLRTTTWLQFDTRCKELSGSAALSNLYVRSLGGPDVYKLNLSAVGDEHYAVAKRTLQSFDVVLPTRNLSSLPRLLGLPASVEMPNEVTEQHAAIPETPDLQLLALLEERNQLDARLYDDAVGMFEGAISQAGRAHGAVY